MNDVTRNQEKINKCHNPCKHTCMYNILCICTKKSTTVGNMVTSSAVKILLEIEEESVIVIWAGTIHCCPSFPLPYSEGDLLCVWSFDETMSAACVQLLCNLKEQFQNKSVTCHNFQTTSTRHFLHRSVTKESAVTQESANIQ